MKPRLSARLLFAGIGAVACLSVAFLLEAVYAASHTSAWVDDHETPSLLFFHHVRNETERRLQEASAQSGDVEVTLTWNNLNDLDLHCFDPNGVEVFYASRASNKTEGRLDVDRNFGPPYTMTPVEHIYWPRGRAPAGAYSVYVAHYARHGSLDPTNYQVTVKNYGQTTHFAGSISKVDFPDPTRGKFICKFNAAPPPFAFLGRGPGYWRSIFVAALWSAALAVGLTAAILVGLALFYWRVYKKRFSTFANCARLTALSGLWGLPAGAIGQMGFTFLPDIMLKDHPQWSHAIGFLVLAGLVGLAFGGRIPHMRRGPALLAGMIGGLLAGPAFFRTYKLFGERLPAESHGRVVAAIVIGALIGFAVSLVVEPPKPPVEPEEFGDEQIYGLQPLSLRAHRIGPSGKLRRVAREKVHH